jgi:hypothetical protein
VLEVMGNGVFFDHWSNPYSASGPFADSANPGSVAVGAIDPPAGTTIATYSSRGPTNDGRVKPDLAAASCVTSRSMSFVAPGHCFNGTSAASPAVAGAAATVRGAGVASTPTGVAGYLRSSTVDRGAAGADHTYGNGELILGPPPVPATANDDLADAWPARLGNYTALTGAATHEASEPQHAGSAGAKSVWFRFTAPWSGTFVFDTSGSAFDTLVGAYAGDTYPLTVVASDDDGGAGTASRVTVAATQGTTYRIVVDGKGAAGGLATLAVGATAVCPSAFADVAPTGPFCPSVTWASGVGVTVGYADGTFGPVAPVSRQAMVAFLRRLAGSPAVPDDAPTFSDVAPSSPFYDDVRWAAAAGVTTGFSDDTFRPTAPVSRQALAAFLFRMAGEPADAPPVTTTFWDVAPTSPFLDAISWVTGSGIASGYSDGSFGPTTTVSRQAMTAFLWALAAA